MEQVLKLFGTAGDSSEMGRKLVMGLGVPLTAFVIFLMVKAINNLKRKEEAAPAPPAEPSDEVKLLTEIRDALKR